MPILAHHAKSQTAKVVLDRNKEVDDAINNAIKQGEFATVLPKPTDEAEFVRIALALKAQGFVVQVDKTASKYRIDWSEVT